ncbi:MAG: hypothetical protein ACJ70Z_08020 [Nitrososphaera sp.]
MVNISYLRNNISISFALSAAAIALLLLASPLLPLSNFLLQPAQASLPTSGARTQAPVDGTLSCGGGANPIDAKLTFTVQGTTIDNTWYNLHNGTFQLTNSSNGQVLYSYSGGNQAGGYISIDNRNTWTIVPGFGLDGGEFLCGDNAITMYVTTTCNGEFETITINRGTGGSIGTFPNAVIQCGDFGVGDTTAQQPSSSSPMTATTTPQDSNRDSRDGDGDGIPDSSDNCTHNSNPRCFKEGDTSNTTQQPPTSSNRTGNQTRQ